MKAWGLSDVGVAREHNEDTYLLRFDDSMGMFAVCDGMGGANAGEIASKTAIDAFAAYVMKTPEFFLEKKAEETMTEAIREANRSVFALASGNEEYAGMGTTLVAMLAYKNTAVFGNVGDSRAYYIEGDEIRQITTDHSLVNEMLARGEINEYQAQRYPKRNIITRSIGVDVSVKSDIFTLSPRPGSFVLLCSDGLTNEVSVPEIHYEICGSGHPEKACEELIRIANARGGHDNITVILVSF